MAWKAGLGASLTLLGVGELPLPGDLGTYIQWGALGILGVTIIKLFGELADQRKDAAAERAKHAEVVGTLCDRWDGWEKTRHDDHEELTKTLGTMRENCAAVLQSQGHGPRKPE
jgi:hypothetical protein